MTLPTNYTNGQSFGYVDVDNITTQVNVLTNTRISRSVVTVSSSTTLGATANTDYVAIIVSGGTPTLPTAVSNTNLYTLKNADTVNHTVLTTSSQTIDGSTSIVLTPNTSIDAISDGSNWRVI